MKMENLWAITKAISLERPQPPERFGAAGLD